MRSTLLACITALACVALAIAYVHKTMRYELVGNEAGVFVLDRQKELLHHCDKEKCNLITPDGVSVEALKLIASGPKEAQKQTDPNCPCEVKSKDSNVKNLKPTSFNNLEKPIPPLNEIKEELGMASVNQSSAKPSDPFAGNNSSTQNVNTSATSSSSTAQNTSMSAPSTDQSTTVSSSSMPSNGQSSQSVSSDGSSSSGAQLNPTSSAPTSLSADSSGQQSASSAPSTPANPYG